MGISTSIGLYDFLNYLTIGAILSFIFVPWIPQSAEELALWAIPCFVVGLIFHKVVENSIGRYTRNNKKLILSAFRETAKYSDKKSKEPIAIRREYYRAYYSLSERGQLGNISVLEAISSFFQDIFVIILLYVIIGIISNILRTDSNYQIPNYYWRYITIGGIITMAMWCIVSLVYFHPWIKWFRNKHKVGQYIFNLLILISIVFIVKTCISIGAESKNICAKFVIYNCGCISTSENTFGLLSLFKSTHIAILVYILLSIIPFLRVFTEMQIFRLVWEGYIFLHLNKKIQSNKENQL